MSVYRPFILPAQNRGGEQSKEKVNVALEFPVYIVAYIMDIHDIHDIQPRRYMITFCNQPSTSK